MTLVVSHTLTKLEVIDITLFPHVVYLDWGSSIDELHFFIVVSRWPQSLAEADHPFYVVSTPDGPSKCCSQMCSNLPTKMNIHFSRVTLADSGTRKVVLLLLVKLLRASKGMVYSIWPATSQISVFDQVCRPVNNCKRWDTWSSDGKSAMFGDQNKTCYKAVITKPPVTRPYQTYGCFQFAIIDGPLELTLGVSPSKWSLGISKERRGGWKMSALPKGNPLSFFWGGSSRCVDMCSKIHGVQCRFLA